MINPRVRIKSIALQQLRQLSKNSTTHSWNLYQKVIASGLIPKRAKSLASINDNNSFAQALVRDPIISAKLNISDDYSLSYLGYIPGNQIQLISENDQSEERVRWVNERIMFNGAKLDWSKPYMRMPIKDKAKGIDEVKNYDKNR